jgi:hypothetical protein
MIPDCDQPITEENDFIAQCFIASEGPQDRAKQSFVYSGTPCGMVSPNKPGERLFIGVSIPHGIPD